MRIYELIEPGDFALVDSTRFCPRIVKYFMRSPHLWADLWRMITKKLEKPLYYHALMFLSKDEIIEQQSKVVRKSSAKILNTVNNLLIFRLKGGLTLEQKTRVCEEAIQDLGKGYDILNCFGDFLSWLTAIPFFKTYMELSNAEICINRCAKWYKNALGENFGVKKHTTLTTHTLWKYVINNLEKFEIIYRGNPRKDNLLGE